MKFEADTGSFYVTKHSTWKGKYKRVLVVSDTTLTTLSPSGLEVTNKWDYADVVDVQPASSNKTEFTLLLKKDKKCDSLKFSCDFRASLLTKVLSYKHLFADKSRECSVSYRNRCYQKCFKEI